VLISRLPTRKSRIRKYFSDPLLLLQLRDLFPTLDRQVYADVC
jgi:hypothetical protein